MRNYSKQLKCSSFIEGKMVVLGGGRVVQGWGLGKTKKPKCNYLGYCLFFK